jgi:hypothetical protein
MIIAIGLAWPPSTRAAGDTDATAIVKAGFLENFAKFTEWPALPPSAPIVLCVVADAAVAAALADAVRGHLIEDHAVDVRQPVNSRSWTGCQLLFIGKAEINPLVLGKAETQALPLLTVSDRKGFSHDGGAIELYIDDGHMRFAVNLQAVKRSDIHLSSKLLTLAKLVH